MTSNPPNAYPSPFYAQFEGAFEVTLCFPVDEDGVGPHWLESGELVAGAQGSQDCESVEAVDLGAGRYRLAYKAAGPFSGLRLNWGDEFLAEKAGRNRLRMLRVVTPAAYRHYRFLTSPGFGNETPLAALVHRFGGGWETVAGGMLTLTVPAASAAEFEQAAREDSLFPPLGLE